MAVRSASVTCVTWATASSLSLDPLPSDEPPSISRKPLGTGTLAASRGPRAAAAAGGAK